MGNKPKINFLLRFLREILSIILWLFIIIKIFLFDFDYYVISNYFPKFTWLVKYKFFIAICLISFLWITLHKKFKFILLFFFGYPFIILFWRIPKLILKTKSWVIVFFSISTIISFSKSIKLNFIIFSISVTSFLLILVNDSNLFILISIISLFITVIIHYIRRIIYSFSPSQIFKIQTDVISNISKFVKNAYKIPDQLKLKENLDEQETKTIQTNLQIVTICNKICYFIATKLKKFKKLKINLVYYFLNLFYTFCFTIINFTFINFALFKIDHFAFNSSSNLNLLSFLYYSINTFFRVSIPDFYPISTIARLINSVELIFACSLFAIVIFLFTSIIKERHDEEISTAIINIKDQGKSLEAFISDEFKISVEQAIDQMEKLKSSLINIIYYLTKNIDKE